MSARVCREREQGEFALDSRGFRRESDPANSLAGGLNLSEKCASHYRIAFSRDRILREPSKIRPSENASNHTIMLRIKQTS
jgi:hypothetical protein